MSKKHQENEENPVAKKPRTVKTEVNAAKLGGTSRRDIQRDKLEADILLHAVKMFAECGYEGTSIASIAEQVGLSKQNLLYYFSNKQSLYQRVLDDVLDAWLDRMDSLADETREPQELLRLYIQAKLRFSREQPWG